MLNKSRTNFSSNPNDAFRQAKHSDSRSLMRRKADHIREVEVEGEQTTILPYTGLKDDFVAGAPESFHYNCFGIVAGLKQDVRSSGTEDLIALESHAALLPGKSK